MDSDGTNVKLITNGRYHDTYPSWSPDGTKIAFWRQYAGVGIYYVNSNGTGALRRLSPWPGWDVTPSWSPNGERIIFTRILQTPIDGQTPDSQIMSMNVNGSDVRLLIPSNGTFNIGPRWSPNGTIALMRGINGVEQHIYTFNIADPINTLTKITDQGSNGDPAWSPDGSMISFGSNREGNGKLNVFVMNADGSNVRQVTFTEPPLEAGDTSWSPDGKRIAFELDWPASGQSNPNANAEVWTVNIDGTEPYNTKQMCSAVGCSPRWSPS